MGRFDFLWDGEGLPKMAEYNADTPTVLVESAIAQRQWLEDIKKRDRSLSSVHDKQSHKTAGQFNVLPEMLSQAFANITAEMHATHRLFDHLESGASPPLHIAFAPQVRAVHARSV
jgi:glutathionylspermidine synthase